MENDDRYKWDLDRGKDLGMNRPIARRDFLQGVAITGAAVGFSGLLGQAAAGAAAPGQHGRPPFDQTGLRGEYDGSIVVPHAVVHDEFSSGRIVDTGESYDLVVVGGGISGLAAAHFFRQAHPDATVLVIDNLDDYGGEAKRNEFNVDGHQLIGYAGSQSIDSPDTFPPEVTGFLYDIGVRLEDFYTYYDTGFNTRHNLSSSIFFDKEHYGQDKLVIRGANESYADYAHRFPLAPSSIDDLIRLQTTTVDYLPGRTDQQKKDYLATISYLDYVRKYIRMNDQAISLIQRNTEGEWALGIDAISALDAWGIGESGFDGLNLIEKYEPIMAKSCQRALESEVPYIFHFPDGNGGVARLTLRSLIPEAVPGDDQADSVLAPIRYDLLDKPNNQVRVRLNSTCVKVTNQRDGVDVRYAQSRTGNKYNKYTTYKVRGKQVVVACWNTMAAFIVDGLSTTQRDALLYSVKAPLVYTNVAIRNWRPFAELGVGRVSTPGLYWHGFGMDFPISIDGYHFTSDPSQPTVLHLESEPTFPGHSGKEQFEHGAEELLSTPFDFFEFTIRDMLARGLAGTSFNPARDIAGITVNRWAHGYAYELMSLWDPADYLPEEERPYAIARQRLGNVAFANTDSAGTAFADTAIEMAYRAVNDLLADDGIRIRRPSAGMAYRPRRGERGNRAGRQRLSHGHYA